MTEYIQLRFMEQQQPSSSWGLVCSYTGWSP